MLEKRTYSLCLSTLLAQSADEKLLVFIYLFIFNFPENKAWHFLWPVYLEDDSHEISNPTFWENYLKCLLPFVLDFQLES